jgi:DNA (cytosine-5)-methyltransferase 1
MARIIGECQPRFVFLENSPTLIRRGLDRIVRDLAAMGYVSRWAVIGADDAGFAHHRKRLWLVGDSCGEGLERHAWDVKKKGKGKASNRHAAEASLRLAGWKRVIHSADCDDEGDCPGCGADFSDCRCPDPTMEECQYCEVDGELWARPKIRFIEPSLGRVAHGVAARMDRLRAIGNGQVPSVAALAWNLLR